MNLKDGICILRTKDFLVTGKSFDLRYDLSSDMLYTHPSPHENQLSQYYKSDAYISHTDKKKGFIPLIYNLVKKYSQGKKLALLDKLYRTKGTLLDIGAGTGDFILGANKAGWITSGIEPNIKARNIALAKGLMLDENIDSYIEKQFDAITLWHVLEHIKDLPGTVKNLGQMVKPNGILLIAVPNYKSYDSQKYKEHWAAYDVPRHLWHFSKKSILHFFQQEFKLEYIEPLKFDSYYVSILSEKYKTGCSFSFKGIWTGFISNLKASKTGEYSSNIYCLRKI